MGSSVLAAPPVQSASKSMPQRAQAPAAVPSPAPSPAGPQFGGTYVQVKLQKALVDAAGRLPNLEPWQSRILNEEVVPQAQRFVRDYRATANGNFTVDVDLETLKNYLKFFGPKSLKKENPLFVVLVRGEEGCVKCEEAGPALRKIAKERIERRGSVPVFVGTDEVDAKLAGKALEARIAQLVEEKKASGSLLLHWYKAPLDDVDTAHADELRFVVRSALVVKDVSHHEGQLELFEAGSFEKTALQLLTDFFTDLGTKIERGAVAGTEPDRADSVGFALEVSGFQNFQQYNQLKERILGLSSAGLLVEERKISRGRAVFALFGEKSVEELRKIVGQIEIPQGSEIRMELKP